MTDKIIIENINHPGHTERVDREKYDNMRQALLKVLPSETPGVKVSDAKAALLSHLNQGMFPDGAKAGWWLKAVQLDLEAKNIIARATIKPIHLYKI